MRISFCAPPHALVELVENGVKRASGQCRFSIRHKEARHRDETERARVRGARIELGWSQAIERRCISTRAS